jgi:hypothetical protein
MLGVKSDGHALELVWIRFPAHREGVVPGVKLEPVSEIGALKRISGQVSLDGDEIILQPLPNLIALGRCKIIQLPRRERLGRKETGEEFDVRVMAVNFRVFIVELASPDEKVSVRELGENSDRAVSAKGVLQVLESRSRGWLLP